MTSTINSSTAILPSPSCTWCFFNFIFWFVYNTADHNKRHHLFDCNYTLLFIFMFFVFVFFVFGYIPQLPCTSTCPHAHAPSPCSVSTCIGVCIFFFLAHPPSLSFLFALWHLWWASHVIWMSDMWHIWICDMPYGCVICHTWMCNTSHIWMCKVSHIWMCHMSHI